MKKRESLESPLVKIHSGPYGDVWIAQEEPVAHVYRIEPNGRPCVAWDDASGIKVGAKLYAATREWVGLTDEEKEKLVEAFYGTDIQRLEAVEAKLKEKNT